MKNSTKEDIITLGGIVFTVGFIGCRGYAAGSTYTYSTPNTDKVQSGYVIPNKLEIKLGDLDQNGENEVLLKYDGKPYLFRLNDKGEPVVVPYTITPRE